LIGEVRFVHTIGMCVDENYFLPSMVTLASLADATQPRDRAATAVRILTSDLTTGRGATMAAFVRRLGFGSFDIARDRPSHSYRIIHGSYISTTTYLRFNFTPEFVKHPYLIYMDSDVLVLGDIFAPLSQVGDGQVGLVRDLVNHTVGCQPGLPGVVARWPDLKGRQYFNAGMLWTTITVLPHLRRQIDKIMAADTAHIYFNDQDALNLWALRNDGAVQPLDTTYNMFELDRFYEGGDWIRRVANRIGPRSSPAVLHFVGPPKPWHRSCPLTDGTRLYRRYLRDVTRHLHRLGDLTATVPPLDPADSPPAPSKAARTDSRSRLARRAGARHPVAWAPYRRRGW
jgi:lipopolysaccharide biosynthesis glycosyltransferase